MDASVWAEPWLLLAALVVEACVGYPQWIYRSIRHPVVWMGHAIDTIERSWNKPELTDIARRLLGILTVALVAGSAGFIGYI
ncbi:MAG: cobalamin biosynthesis protein, partial [Steroidobacter sp.]